MKVRSLPIKHARAPRPASWPQVPVACSEELALGDVVALAKGDRLDMAAVASARVLFNPTSMGAERAGMRKTAVHPGQP